MEILLYRNDDKLFCFPSFRRRIGCNRDRDLGFVRKIGIGINSRYYSRVRHALFSLHADGIVFYVFRFSDVRFYVCIHVIVRWFNHARLEWMVNITYSSSRSFSLLAHTNRLWQGYYPYLIRSLLQNEESNGAGQ